MDLMVREMYKDQIEVVFVHNRVGRTGFQNRNGRGQGYQERFNCMNEDDCDEGYDDDMSNDELFMCCVSELQENTGFEFCFEESN